MLQDLDLSLSQLTESVLGGPVSIPTSQFLWNTTHGNVLFLHEVVTAGLEGGAFTCSGRTWMWQGPLRVSARSVTVPVPRTGDGLGEP